MRLKDATLRGLLVFAYPAVLAPGPEPRLPRTCLEKESGRVIMRRNIHDRECVFFGHSDEIARAGIMPQCPDFLSPMLEKAPGIRLAGICKPGDL